MTYELVLLLVVAYLGSRALHYLTHLAGEQGAYQHAQAILRLENERFALEMWGIHRMHNDEDDDDDPDDGDEPGAAPDGPSGESFEVFDRKMNAAFQRFQHEISAKGL
jgi:hypothetical protein